MKKLLLLIAFMSTIPALAQESLFQIISFNGIVKLDETQVVCNQSVTSQQQKLKIEGKGSYAIILTEKGYAFLLSRGNYAVLEISNREDSNVSKWIQPTGVIHDGPRDDLGFVAIEDFNFVYGDSITLIWRPKTIPSHAYILTVQNIFGEDVYESTTETNVHTFKVSPLFDNMSLLVYHLNSDDNRNISRDRAIKNVTKKERDQIAYDLSCAKSEDFINHQLARMAVFETFNLYYDQVHHLHKLWAYTRKTGVKIKHPYYLRLMKTYKLQEHVLLSRN